jgi:glycosyltransferase involved in cell wall biosynthesis
MRAYFSFVARGTTRAAAVLVDSESTRTDVQAHLGIPAERVHVAYLGVNAAFRPAAPRAGAPSDGQDPVAQNLAARLGLPARYGLYLGGFDARKNVRTLMAAWRAVHAATGVVLVLAGRPPANVRVGREPIDVTARRAGLTERAYTAVGPVPRQDLPALYRGAAVFAYPSRYEGFGLPPLEAMACGVPVVASDATSLPEVVGDAGVLLPPDDVEAWSRALIEVMTDEAAAARLRQAGLRRASTFTWAETARRTLAVYRSVARDP